MAIYKPAAGTIIVDALTGARITTADGNTYYEGYDTYVPTPDGKGQMTKPGTVGFQGGDAGPAIDAQGKTVQQLNSESGGSALPTTDAFGNTVGDMAGTIYKAQQDAIAKGAVQLINTAPISPDGGTLQAGMKRYPAGTKLYHKDGSTSIASDTTSYGAEWGTTPTTSTKSTSAQSAPTSEKITSGYVAIPVSSTSSGGTKSSYTGPSVVDYLNSIGQASDFTSRSRLAAQYGITGYSGTAAENTKLLETLRKGEVNSTTSSLSYFQYTPNGLVPVTDQNTINSIKNGDLTAQKYDSLASVPTYSVKNQITPEETAFLESEAFKSLSAGEQQSIRSILDAIQTNDGSQQELLKKAFEAAARDADPIFKQELKIAIDALTRGFAYAENDLAYSEKQLSDRLNDLRADIALQKGNLSIDQEKELRQLERQYESQLENTRQDLASSGFTDSSRRAKAEDILNETKGDMVESTNRAFATKQTTLDNSLSRGARDTTDEIARLRELTTRGKTDLGRKGESVVGSGNLPTLSGYNKLGGVIGSAEQKKQADIDQAALTMFNMGFVY